MTVRRTHYLLLAVVALAMLWAPAASAVRPIVRKTVSPKVAARIKLAARAIRFVRAAIPNPGNQVDAVIATRGNACSRATAARAITPLMFNKRDQKRAKTYPLAAQAAGIIATKGGFCGEHAGLTMQYLAGLNKGEKITKVSLSRPDHAFVIIGDPKKDRPDELVVVDAWIKHPQPLLWTDYRFFRKDKDLTIGSVPKKFGNRTRQARRSLTRALRKALEDTRRSRSTGVMIVQGMLDKTNSVGSKSMLLGLPGYFDVQFGSKKDYRYVTSTSRAVDPTP